jgi:hypothetical protein
LQPEDKNPDVSNLDDGQLKALLDEAITYKCPKDREGKSDLFRVSPRFVEMSRNLSALVLFLASALRVVIFVYSFFFSLPTWLSVYVLILVGMKDI